MDLNQTHTPINAQRNSYQYSYDTLENTQDDSTMLEPDNDSPTMCQLLKEKSWALLTDPTLNLTTAFLLSGVGGGSGMTLAMPHMFDGLDGCDTSNLGSPYLHIGLISGCATLALVNSGMGLIGVKQRSDHLTEAKSDASDALTFNRLAATSDDHDATLSDDGVQERCDMSFNMAMGIHAGTIFLGLFVGTVVELLLAPTELGGSGCNVADIKTGSFWMGLILAALTIVGPGSGYLIYRYRANTNQMLSEAHALRDTRYLPGVEPEHVG